MKENAVGTNVKKLTYMGKEKTQISTMDTESLCRFVGKWVGKRLSHVHDVDESGMATQYAMQCVLELDQYMEDQMGAFATRGLPKERAYKEAIVPTGVWFTNSRGEEIEQYRIIKRGESLEPVFEDKDGDHGASIRASMRLPSEIFIGRDKKRGKYNDADIIICQSACSVDHSEAMAM